MDDIFIKALSFASVKHSAQRRKGSAEIPYINHLISVTHILYFTGNERDPEILAASILHDIIEDTEVTESELNAIFGNRVASVVAEVTDNMALTYEERKREQIKKAEFISGDAKKIKIADKISNINDILTQPLNWSERRKMQYVDWALQVVQNCKGVNTNLDLAFTEIYTKAKAILKPDI